MSIPMSSLFKAEYLAASHTLKRRDWLQIHRASVIEQEYLEHAYRIMYWVMAEPLVTERLLKHILANQLNEVDKPLAEQSPSAGSGRVILFEPDPAIPMNPKQFNPALMDRAIDRSPVARNWLQNLKIIIDLLQRERAQQATIEVAIALQAYQRKHGEFPEDVTAAIPDFLDLVPVDPCDPTGQLLRYRRNDPYSAVVWSIGPDGHDHDGDVIETKSGKSPDVGFLLKSH